MHAHAPTLATLSLAVLAACGAREGSPGEDIGTTRQALTDCPGFNDGRQCLQGTLATTYAADRNRCVPDVDRQFRALKSHGEIMGFWDGGAAVDYPYLDADYQHWQGIQRLAYPPSHRNLLVMTSSHEVWNGGGHYALVALGSRFVGGLTGRRLGGNRMLPTDQDWDVLPAGNDDIEQSGTTSAPLTFSHPSATQALGQYLAVGLEVIKGGGPEGRTQLFDTGVSIDFGVKDCTGTTPGCMQTEWRFDHSEPGDGAVALAKLEDGRYLMINAIGEGIQRLEINVSGYQADGETPRSITDLRPFGNHNRPDATGEPSAIFDMAGLTGWDESGFQSLQLVSECDTGHLYLIGIGQHEGSEEDWAELYRLNFVPSGTNSEGEPRLQTTPAYMDTYFQHIRSKHFWCTYEGSPRQCDFDAASGVYVDPYGTLLLYATVKDDSGPEEGVTRFVEFAPSDPVDRPNTTAIESCDTPEKMWVELSNEQLLSTTGLPPVAAERFFVENANESRSHANFETAYSFDNEAMSIRHCIPPGYRYKLCTGTSFTGTCQFFCGSSVAGCTGSVSGGQIRGVNFASATASSGCFTTTTSSSCL